MSFYHYLNILSFLSFGITLIYVKNNLVLWLHATNISSFIKDIIFFKPIKLVDVKKNLIDKFIIALGKVRKQVTEITRYFSLLMKNISQFCILLLWLLLSWLRFHSGAFSDLLIFLFIFLSSHLTFLWKKLLFKASAFNIKFYIPQQTVQPYKFFFTQIKCQKQRTLSRNRNTYQFRSNWHVER